jgi:hypothetical protein
MINKTEKFVIKEIHRSAIKNAPYNPRTINEKQRSGLKRNLKKIGLVYPLVWNESTGNLVSGHQRISLCDEINGTDDYTLTMSVVQLSLKDEIQQNIFLNSTTYQGEFDLIKLKETMLEHELDYKDCGLDEYDLSVININPKDIKIFGNETKDETETKAEEAEAEEVLTPEEKKEAIKQLKKDIQKSYENTEQVKNVDAYVIMSFSNIDNKEAFCRRFDIPIGETIFKGEVFSNMVERIE